jgi:calcium-dependent protein kinase
MHFMLVGDYPFKGRTNAEVFSKISSVTEANMTVLKDVSPQACDLLKKLLVKNPQFRIGASEALLHPWLHQFNVVQPPSLQELGFVTGFQNITALKFVALSLISKFIQGEELKRIRRIFFFLDSQNQGFLTLEGVKIALGEVRATLSGKVAGKLFKCLSVEQDGKIFFSEFVVACLCGRVSEETLRKSFKILDINNTGQVSVDSLLELHRKGGKSFFDGISKGDSFDKMSFEEFKALVNSPS